MKRIEMTKSVRKVFESAGIDLRRFGSYYVEAGYLCGQSHYTAKPRGECISGSLVKIHPVSDEELGLILRLVERDKKEEVDKKKKTAIESEALRSQLASLPETVNVGGEILCLSSSGVHDEHGNYLFPVPQCSRDELEGELSRLLEEFFECCE